MAINDVLPPKATRRNAIANLKILGSRDTSDLISMVFLQSLCGATLLRSHRHHSKRLRKVGKKSYPSFLA